MRTIAAKHGFKALVAPVRPTLKSRYPLTPMDRYARWQRADGTPFDPWLRTHSKLGAELLRMAPQSMVITGTVAEWEAWTAMRFPESGAYVVSGALPVGPGFWKGIASIGIDSEPSVHHWYTSGSNCFLKSTLTL